MSTLNWMGCEDEPNAETPNGTRFDVERAGEARWWAYRNDKPVGIYASPDEAKRRCEALAAKEPSGVAG